MSASSTSIAQSITQNNTRDKQMSSSRLRPFFELGKFKLIELWLGFFVGVTALPHTMNLGFKEVVILGAILCAGICIIAATCTLDDVTGVRDGVDQANHQPNR